MWSKILLCCLLSQLTNSFVHQGVGSCNIAARNGLFAGDKDDETIIEGDYDEASMARRDFVYNTVGAGLIAASGVASFSLFQSNAYAIPTGMQRLPRTQFIAALGDPKSSEGIIAQDGSWGLWPVDPGPRGVWLRNYKTDILQSETKFRAPAGWTFDPKNWWLEEHGLIMEAPDFPLKEGKYLVTGGRKVTTTLTVEKGGKWKLDEGTLYDVTHLPCRSARYQPISGGEEGAGTPTAANPRDFPVTPGAIMPSVPGAKQQDYAVLFVVGKAV